MSGKNINFQKLYLEKKYSEIIKEIENLDEKQRSSGLLNLLGACKLLRRIIAPMGTMDAIEFINSKLKDTKNNAEFFNSMNKPS